MIQKRSFSRRKVCITLRYHPEVIRDYFGKVLGEYFAPQDGVMMYVISSLAINVGDPIVALG